MINGLVTWRKFDSRWGLRNSFSEYFYLRTFLLYLHCIQVADSFITYNTLIHTVVL